MQIRIIEFLSDAYQESIRLRDEMLRKPLGMVFYQEDLDKEFDSVHLGCYNDNSVLVACLVLKPISSQEIKMRQVAVDEEYQGRGIGSFLVESSEHIAGQMGFSEMTLHARENAVPFYLRMEYTVLGDQFEEVGLPHFKMRKAI